LPSLDNIQNIGLSYIMREYKKQTMLTFMVEILNWVIDQVEDCYILWIQKGIIIMMLSMKISSAVMPRESNYNSDKLSSPDSRFDLDCESGKAY
jgi:hypothetical protein